MMLEGRFLFFSSFFQESRDGVTGSRYFKGGQPWGSWLQAALVSEHLAQDGKAKFTIHLKNFSFIAPGF